MHAAPPVRYPIKPSRLRQACEGGVFILAVLCLGFWAYQTEPSLLRGLLALCLCSPALALMLRSAFLVPPMAGFGRPGPEMDLAGASERAFWMAPAALCGIFARCTRAVERAHRVLSLLLSLYS